MSDRLALANAIEDTGIERSKAERVASVSFDAIHDNVATKAVVQASEAALKSELQALRHYVQRGGAATSTSIPWNQPVEPDSRGAPTCCSLTGAQA